MNAQSIGAPIIAPIDDSPFPSLATLRTAHNKLLEAHRAQAESADFWSAVEQFVRRGSHTGVLLDREEDRWAAQSLLDYWTATAYSIGRTMPDGALVDFDPSLAPTLPDDQCPYVGLASFREGQEKYFFGRERLVNLLAEQVAAARLVAVVGPSGSGKSSLVLAGLLPALKSGIVPGDKPGADSRHWRYLDRLVPGSDPLANLAHIVQPKSVNGALDTTLAAQLLFAADGFRRDATYLLNLLKTTDMQPVVLVVDQFEEIFTLCTDEAARKAFIDNLLALAEAPDARHIVILTMRTDFESFVARVPQLLPHFEKALVRVTPLNAAELRAVIEKPAEIVGLKFEAGVVDALVQDVLGEPAALPLLQFTLLKLWEQRDRNRITWASYKRLGGGRLALARSADQLYESLIHEEQVTARRILLRLVRPGDGLEVTSNRVRQSTFYQSGEARDRVERVLQKLVKADLLRLTAGERPEDNQVEVAHEALVRNWPRLVGWLEDERERIRERLRITEAAEQWLKLGRDPGALLRGALLEDALRYNDLSEVEQHYVKASQAAIAAVEQEKEAARQRELEQAHALAAEQERLVKTERHWAAFQEQTVVKLRQRAWLLGVITAAAILLAAAAVWFSVEANRHSQEANIARQDAEQQAVAAKTAEAMAQMEAAVARTAEAELHIKQTQLSHLNAALSYADEKIETELLTSGAANLLLPGTEPQNETPYPSVQVTPVSTRLAITDPIAVTVTNLMTEGQVVTETASLTTELNLTPDAPTSNAGIFVIKGVVTALVPDVEINLYEAASEKSTILRTLRAPEQLTVLQADAYWVKAVTDEGTEGWVEAYTLTYTGDTSGLPIALQYRVATLPDPAQSESKTPFTYGEIISVEGATAYPLLDDLQNPDSAQIEAPVGAPVTLLFEATGPVAYGSERWYYVQLSDPGGRNLLYPGYLPAAVIVQR